jgi:hypothetical protein
VTREYPVKKTIKLSPDYILEVVKPIAENARLEGEHILCSIPGLKMIEFSINNKKLLVSTETSKDNKDPMKTIKLFNEIIEKITGYSVKERKKLMSKI